MVTNFHLPIKILYDPDWVHERKVAIKSAEDSAFLECVKNVGFSPPDILWDIKFGSLRNILRENEGWVAKTLNHPAFKNLKPEDTGQFINRVRNFPEVADAVIGGKKLGDVFTLPENEFSKIAAKYINSEVATTEVGKGGQPAAKGPEK